MGITKKINIESIFIFLFLIVFPFGQIIRLSFNLGGLNIPLQPLDIVVGLGAVFSLFFQKNKPKSFRYISYYLLAALFSFILSIFYFKTGVLYGLFYLIRISAYALFINYVWNFIRRNKDGRKLLINSLMLISIVSAVFGWIQFFSLPDLKPFFVYGWDMHLLRLFGTFLDPTFLGLIIVFGIIISVFKLIEFRDRKYLLITAFLLISLAFTYSRASYAAFLGGMLVISLMQKKFRKILLLVLTLIIIALLLPTARNHSIELTRTFSITARLNNYKEAFSLFKKFPVFGVGYDNLCIARNKFIGVESFASHACSGSDSSLLLILATTGMVGMLVFLGASLRLLKDLSMNSERQIILAAGSALFIHSFFSNSLFFPWIMGFMAILLAISLKE